MDVVATPVLPCFLLYYTLPVFQLMFILIQMFTSFVCRFCSKKYSVPNAYMVSPCQIVSPVTVKALKCQHAGFFHTLTCHSRNNTGGINNINDSSVPCCVPVYPDSEKACTTAATPLSGMQPSLIHLCIFLLQ